MWDWFQGATAVIVIVVLLVVAAGVGTWIWYAAFKKPILDADRRAIKGSHAYVEGNRTRILKLVTEYNNLKTKISQWKAAEGSNTQVIQDLENQRDAVKMQLKEAVERMEPDQIPEGAKTILNKEIGKNDKEKSIDFVYLGSAVGVSANWGRCV